MTGGLPLIETSGEEITARKDVAQKVDELMENNLAPIQPGEKTEVKKGLSEKVLGIKTEENRVGNVTEARGGKRFVVEKCEQEINNPKETLEKGGGPIFHLGEYRARPRPKMQEDKGGGKGEPMSLQEDDLAASRGKSREKRGPRALRRRPGRRVTRQQRLARRSSINGHW